MDQLATIAPTELSLEDICEFVGNGGTLVKYCQDRALSFSEVHAWVTKHPVRNRTYSAAIATRQDMIAQTLGNMTVSLCRFDPKDVYHADGTYKKIHEWPPEARAALVSLETDKVTGEITKAVFTQRTKSIELLGKMAGVFKDTKVEKDTITLADLVLRSMKNEKSEE